MVGAIAGERRLLTAPTSPPALPIEILERLRCPTCGASVQPDGGPGAWGLSCADGHCIALRDGYLDATGAAVPDEVTSRTAASFGYEWTTFDAIRPEDEQFWRTYFRDVPGSAYEGKVALDAGCGKGRYTCFLAPRVRALAAVDNSDAVEAAARNLAMHANTVVVRADVRELPFDPESFDFVCCLGVLHHLSDPEDGFRRLARLLRPGGHLAIYVYSRPSERGARRLGLAAATRLRTLSVRCPPRLLRLLSAPLAGALYGAFVVPGTLGARMNLGALESLPLATYRGAPVRSLWLDTFDRLSAPVEHRYIREEVEAWFERSGLTLHSIRDEAGFFAVGSKES